MDVEEVLLADEDARAQVVLVRVRVCREVEQVLQREEADALWYGVRARLWFVPRLPRRFGRIVPPGVSTVDAPLREKLIAAPSEPPSEIWSEPVVRFSVTSDA